MPLQMKWHPHEVVLFESATGETSGEATLLARVELDFELGPLALTFDEDRHRLLAALDQLRAEAGLEDAQVDLFIPSSWGVTHRVPDPRLPASDLPDHLRWEISKALIDSEEHYRYNYAFDDSGEILVTAIRLKLFDPIDQVVQESGFQLSSLYFEEGPWDQVNLMGAFSEQTAARRPTVIPDEIDEPEEPVSKSEPVFRERRSGSKFFPVLLIVGVLAILVFVWWKVTSEKKAPMISEPVAQMEETAPEPVDTFAAQKPDEDAAAVHKPAEATTPPPARTETLPRSAWASMSQRISILEDALARLEGQCQFDLISFTENYFLCQVVAEETSTIEEVVDILGDISSLSNVKTSIVPPQDQAARGVVSATLVARGSGTSVVTPRANEVVTLGKGLGLENKELIFTGQREDILNFLHEAATQNFSIYRVILVPWVDDQYRTVLEL